MRPRIPALLGLLTAVGILALAADAGRRDPAVDSVQEVRDPRTGGTLVLLAGKKLKKIDVAELLDSEGEYIATLTGTAGKKGAAFSLPPGIEPGEYRLVLKYGRKLKTLPDVLLHLELDAVPDGAVSRGTLASGLSADLDDAGRVAGRSSTFFRDAGSLGSGELDSGRFDAFGDLRTQSRVDGDDQLALDTFSAADDLVAEGVLDESAQLEPDHYSAFADLQAEGRFAGDGSVPGSLFSAWDNLLGRSEVGGDAGTVAFGDHDHDDDHLPFGGGTMTGPLALEPVSTSQPGLSIYDYATGAAVMRVVNTTSGAGSGLYISTDGVGGDTSAAVRAEATAASGAAASVYAHSAAEGGAGLAAHADADGAVGLYALSNAPATSIVAIHDGGGTGLKAELTTDPPYSGGVTAVKIDANGTGDLAEFQADGTTEARVANDGEGLFNGGIATSGADFAESVRVVGGRAVFEPGDVVVIDPAGERRFAKASGARSPLVAGVVSTKPALLGSLRPVAGDDLPEDEVPLGIVGIVPTKVSAENGAIRPGDALVTAGTVGHAMRAGADPEPGTILGRALGALPTGTGVVEVYVKLR